MISTPTARSENQRSDQPSENALVWSYFGNKNQGTYVEVGANDPKRLSQTWWLEQNGWTGILVEPQSSCCTRLRAERKNSTVYQVACSTPERRGKALFHV